MRSPPFQFRNIELYLFIFLLYRTVFTWYYIIVKSKGQGSDPLDFNFNRLALYFGGIWCTCFGVCLVLQASYGIDAWNSVFAGLAQKTSLSIGAWSIIIQSSFLLIAAILTRNLEFKFVFPIVLKGLLLDVTKSFVLLLPVVNAVYANILLFLLGYLLVGAGTGVYVATGYPKMPIDGLMWAISSFLRWSTNKARLLIEVVGFVTMLLVGGPFGVGTILITFTIGTIIAISQRTATNFLLKDK